MNLPADRLVITVEEAAQLLGIGRGTAYEAARQYIATDGAEGLPCVRLGERRLLVPVDRLKALLAA